MPEGSIDGIKKNEYSFFIPKLTNAVKDERRDHILRAADLCFARSGFQSTTIADVRDEAGVSTGAIYTYFPNKEAMMRAILERARDDRQAQLMAARGDGSAADASVVLLEWVAAIFGAQGLHAARVDVNLWAEALRNPRVHKLAQGALAEAVTAVSAVVAPRLPSIEAASGLQPESVASVLVAIFLGLEVQTAVGLKLDASEVVRVLGALFADYVPSATQPRRPVTKRARSTKRRT